MNINEEIGQFLQEQIDSAISDFKETEAPQLFKDIFEELLKVDKEAVIASFLKQIDKNCIDWWTNADQGINISEKLFCIYFEHTLLTTQELPTASAFGVQGIETLLVQPDYYDLGGDYELASEFYALPGIDMAMCSPMHKLDWDNLPDDLANSDLDVEDQPGYGELLDAYTFTAYFLLHKAVLQFVETSTFARINKKKGFQFLIQEMDLGDAQPLYIDA